MSGQKRRDNSRVPAALPEGLCTVVAEVAPGSNAEKAGVKVGDKIRRAPAAQPSLKAQTFVSVCLCVRTCMRALTC